MAKQYLYHPDDPLKIEINHKNADKQENMQHAQMNDLVTKTFDKGKHIELVDENLNVIDTFTSITNASIFLECSVKTITSNLKANKYGNNTAVIKEKRIKFKVHPNLEGEIWGTLENRV